MHLLGIFLVWYFAIALEASPIPETPQDLQDVTYVTKSHAVPAILSSPEQNQPLLSQSDPSQTMKNVNHERQRRYANYPYSFDMPLQYKPRSQHQSQPYKPYADEEDGDDIEGEDSDEDIIILEEDDDEDGGEEYENEDAEGDNRRSFGFGLIMPFVETGISHAMDHLTMHMNHHTGMK